MKESPAPFWPFGVTLAAICIPFFSIIGFLSTKYGYSVWAVKTSQFWRWLHPKKPPPQLDDLNPGKPRGVMRTMSTEEGMRLRLKDQEVHRRRSSFRPVPSHPHIQRMVESMGEGRQSGLRRMGTVAGSEEKDDSEVMAKDAVIDVRHA